MRYPLVLLFIVGSLFLALPIGGASDETSSTDAFAIELLYTHFESRYTPKDLLHKAQKEAMYIGGEFKKGKEAGMAAIKEFNVPLSRWVTLDALSPYSHIQNYEKGWVEAHPNPALHKILFIEDLVYRFKDHAGRLCILEGFEKLDKQPEGIFIFQYTTWTRSVTKIKSPLYILCAYVRIPGTMYHVSTNMPFRGSSLEEMEKTIAHLDKMLPGWSLMNQP